MRGNPGGTVVIVDAVMGQVLSRSDIGNGEDV